MHRNMHNKIHSVISPLFRIKNADTETGWNVQILRSVWIISAEIRYLLSEQKKFQNKSKNIDEVYQSVFFRCIMFLSYRVTFLCNVLGQIHYTSESPVRYFFYEKVVKWCFFKKNRNNQVNIWALIDITDMDRNDVLLLNDKFAEFWINEMSREEKKKDIRFTFVIQVDEMNDYLQEIFYESQGIFMDKHRSRLPVLYIRKHDILKVKWADNDSKYISINKEMRKELKKIYDDSEIESINS